jgi:Trk K+ transport system NAD-binding subunit
VFHASEKILSRDEYGLKSLFYYLLNGVRTENMAKILATEVRGGILIEVDKRLWRVVRARHVHVGGRGGADNVVYGESTGADSLIGAGILRAKVLVVSFIDPVDSRNVVKKARLLNRNLFITAKADTTSMASILREAGANHVFVDAHETGFSIAKKSAAICGGASNKTLSDAISRARGKQNPFFTGGFLGADENSDASDESVSFVGCVVRSDVDSLATVLGSCTVISWLRDSTHLDVGDIDKPLQVGDELVLSGKTIQLLKVKDTLENEHN